MPTIVHAGGMPRASSDASRKTWLNCKDIGHSRGLERLDHAYRDSHLFFPFVVNLVKVGGAHGRAHTAEPGSRIPMTKAGPEASRDDTHACRHGDTPISVCQDQDCRQSRPQTVPGDPREANSAPRVEAATPSLDPLHGYLAISRLSPGPSVATTMIHAKTLTPRQPENLTHPHQGQHRRQYLPHCLKSDGLPERSSERRAQHCRGSSHRTAMRPKTRNGLWTSCSKTA